MLWYVLQEFARHAATLTLDVSAANTALSLTYRTKAPAVVKFTVVNAGETGDAFQIVFSNQTSLKLFNSGTISLDLELELIAIV